MVKHVRVLIQPFNFVEEAVNEVEPAVGNEVAHDYLQRKWVRFDFNEIFVYFLAS